MEGSEVVQVEGAYLSEVSDQLRRERRGVVDVQQATCGIDGGEDGGQIDLHGKVSMPKGEANRVLQGEV